MMNQTVSEMGKRIALLRKNKNLTQEELADRAGLSLQTISTAERGTKGLRPENIVKISEALETSTDYLLTGDPASKSSALLDCRLSSLLPNKQDQILRILDILLEDT
ncbi:MAG: helix-turn-helix transcriptional regulator [Fusicatenibacter sp.]|nr:helix-turn-helix transcriptional regulator [Lachnospiraceae bacterium]MDY2937631.1 helix-turn-helix transcriptional regulator [Fusicatenibacter sp.]